MIQRFSSRRQRLDDSFLRSRLLGARSYDRIAGYFCSSLLEVAGEEQEPDVYPARSYLVQRRSCADLFPVRTLS
jgi:hypothetical protein